jgi:hypothetical protein
MIAVSASAHTVVSSGRIVVDIGPVITLHVPVYRRDQSHRRAPVRRHVPAYRDVHREPPLRSREQRYDRYDRYERRPAGRRHY